VSRTRSVRVTRNHIVRRWGTPQVTIGSVNEPRECEEQGVRFNEKWIYRAPKGDPMQPVERVVYWLRYDYVASFVRDRDGRVTRDDPREFADPHGDRRWVPPSHDAQQVR
jgi:hypothetical protein